MAKIKGRHRLAFALIGIGLLMAIWGLSAQFQPRTENEDNISWCIWAIGVSLSAAGVTMRFTRLARPAVVIPIAVASPFVVFTVLVVLYWAAALSGVGAWPTQAAMINSGYRRIPEAQQIDDLFGPAWHSMANYRERNTADWISEATLGGRYELTMLVAVTVDKQTGQLAGIVSKPRIFLREVTSVQGRAISYGREFEISPDEWQQVVAADGDFSVIGIPVELNNPIAGFAELQNRPRNGIQMVAD